MAPPSPAQPSPASPGLFIRWIKRRKREKKRVTCGRVPGPGRASLALLGCWACPILTLLQDRRGERRNRREMGCPGSLIKSINQGCCGYSWAGGTSFLTHRLQQHSLCCISSHCSVDPSPTLTEPLSTSRRQSRSPVSQPFQTHRHRLIRYHISPLLHCFGGSPP